MTDEKTVPGDDTAAPAPQPSDTGGNEHLIPKARLDAEIAKRRETEEQLAHMAESIVATVPEKWRGLIPDGTLAQKAAWVQQARATGIFDEKPAAPVPATDDGKPKTTPKDQDLSDLPASARMAAGYK
ncbi:MAG: hypothetical protein ACPGO3_05490 [Magnetospiraceae bacterium]